MKLQFDANQSYQLEAISSIVKIFEGQPSDGSVFQVVSTTSSQQQSRLFQESIVGNSLLIADEQIAENVHAVQLSQGIAETATVSRPFTMGESIIGGPDHIGEGTWLEHGRNFTVEMETGTGKTYVYLRTIHELHKTYDFKKFIIVVPSVAIREGVLKSLKITKEHFDDLYNKPEMNFFVWDSKKRNQAKQFAVNNTLQIMVINIDSFTKNENIMRQGSDWGVPLEYIKATQPIVILDEPQNMETAIRKTAIADLNPLCTLRYSATHKNYYNLLYKLDPVKAYDLGLVKKIEVDSVVSTKAYNDAHVKLLKVDHKNKSLPIAHIEVDRGDESGLQRKVLKVEPGDDLERLTRREIYAGYVVDEISAAERYVTFANHIKLTAGEENQALQDEVLKYQIRRTIEDHFEKELRFHDRGIKVLSLFFVDSVANYRQYLETGDVQKGKFALWFEEIFNEVSQRSEYKNLIPFTAEEVHNGYFAQDKNGIWKDSKDVRGEGAKAKDDESAYHLIMQAKEKLLDAQQPLRFIFSHSALREGWDNPNVFQICTLREMSKELERRQTIGRGLRLPVDQSGQRIYNSSINVLTVIANESYEDFARKLQTELEEQTGVTFGEGRIKEKPKQRSVKLRKNVTLNEDFKELWDQIKHKTRYHVSFDTNELISKALSIIDDEVIIRPPKIVSSVAMLTMDKSGISGNQLSSKAVAVERDFPIPDVLSKISAHTGLTRKTIFEILDRSELLDYIPDNPQQVIDELTRVIKVVMEELNVDGIKYEKTGEAWEMQRFENEELNGYLFDEASKQGLVAVDSDKTTHEYVSVDSDIERNYLKSLEDNRDVRFYCKLPGWFKIDTPLGGYNPDWAVVFQNDQRVYFVSETKAENTLSGVHLTDSEKRKIKSARRHFDMLGVPFIAPTNSFQDTLEKI
ncbi:MAG TPA: DEAD/DEAH box helicase family protein [Candidatus Saccharimonadia bacterium]|nr:DEAD/DEAH box helicase family protein [Candidatus Saccharimonadia bacterium]